jgi:hypothetical protein
VAADTVLASNARLLAARMHFEISGPDDVAAAGAVSRRPKASAAADVNGRPAQPLLDVIR